MTRETNASKLRRFALPLGVPLSALALAAALPASAQDDRAGRYTMHKSDDGFVRLDTQTGEMSLCQKTATGWGCAPMSDNSGESQSDVARLRRENANLREEVRRLEELLGLRGDRDRSARRDRDFRLPTEKEVDQAMDYFERMLKKFQDRLKRLEEGGTLPPRKDDSPEAKKEPAPERKL